MATLISSYTRQGDLGETFTENISPPPGFKIRKIEVKVGTGPFTEVTFANPYLYVATASPLNDPRTYKICCVAAPVAVEYVVDIVMGNGGQLLDANPGANTIREGADFRPRFVPFSGKELAQIIVSNTDGSSPVAETIANRQNHTVVLDNLSAAKKIYATFRNI